MQNIWRTVSVPDHNGVFIWEVMEYMPYEGIEIPDTVVKCRDGSYVFPMCYHYFTNETAEKHLNEQYLANFGAVYHSI